jgi:hypothetical protein
VTRDPFPTTNTRKIWRSVAIENFKAAVENVLVVENLAETSKGSLGIESTIDPNRSFLKNGGDSIAAVRWSKEMKVYFHGNVPDWRSLLNDPLGGDVRKDQVDIPCVEPVAVDPMARHILLTGATGFLGKHVLIDLLKKNEDAIIVCLVRPQSKSKLSASERVLVVTEVPMELKYRQVVHLSAKVDHIQGCHSLKEAKVAFTERLLRLKLAPLLLCSTSSTRQGHPRFQMAILRPSGKAKKWYGGALVWGNPKD